MTTLLKKNGKAYQLTGGREKIGGKCFTTESGNNFVIWPETLAIDPCDIAFTGDALQDARNEKAKPDKFRNDFPGTIRTKDGHWVRSKTEVIIDDALYY